ncbi:MAG: outer membrane beta-barrel protein [Saprospiraceae bacterium]|nr:outer membrane beta-barrel protein [Saprospiraceae bacterium]
MRPMDATKSHLLPFIDQFMNFLRILLGCSLAVLGGMSEISAQRGAELGGWLGGAHYFGDINNLYRLNEPGLALGGTARFNFNSRLYGQVQLNYARLRGDDAKSDNFFDQRRNLAFFTDLFEINPVIGLHFFDYIHGHRGFHLIPYMTMGFSVFQYSPKRSVDGTVYRLREIGTEGQVTGQEYGPISGAWTFGLGAKFDLNYRWSVQFDFNARIAFTDYLDDVSTVYPDVNQLGNQKGAIAAFLSDPSLPDINQQKIGQRGFQRGDSNDRDMFVTLGVGLMYYFGRLSCPPISYPN